MLFACSCSGTNNNVLICETSTLRVRPITPVTKVQAVGNAGSLSSDQTFPVTASAPATQTARKMQIKL